MRACGCIPFRRTRERELVALLVLNGIEEGHWEFPKGKQEQGETDEETALRELREETGLVGELGPEEPIEIAYDCTVRGERYHKTVRYFFCRVPDVSAVTIPEDELLDHVWLPLEELEARATHESLKQVARRACSVLAD